MKYRKSAVAGMFYPESCAEIKRYIAHFESQLTPIECTIKPRLLIVPHAGYLYSGYTATLAYAYAAKFAAEYERVVVIGPSHRVFVSGASIALHEAYHTPCGELAIDGEFSHQLQNAFSSLGFNPQAHEEHSTEVQMPFIRHYFKHTPVVEIVYGDITSIELSSIIDTLLVSEKTLVVISTDLSHFYTQEEANALDKHCIAAIQALDEQALSHGCEACGITGIKALVHSAKTHHFTPYLLDYRTSYERTKDASRVVGYTSFVVG